MQNGTINDYEEESAAGGIQDLNTSLNRPSVFLIAESEDKRTSDTLEEKNHFNPVIRVPASKIEKNYDLI